MKYIVIIFLILAINCGKASNFHTSQIGLGGNGSRWNNSTQVSCFYDGQVYLLNNVNTYINSIFAFKIESNNRAGSLTSFEFPNEDYIASPISSCMCEFNNALYVFSNFENGGGGFSYYYRTSKWHSDGYHSFKIPGLVGVERSAVAAIKDTLGLFYVDYHGNVYYKYMTTDNKWSDPKKIIDQIIVDNYDKTWESGTYGNIACVRYRYKNELVFALAYTGKNHKTIYFKLFNTKGEKIKETSHKLKYSIYNLSMVDGSVDGAGHGRPIQCFYSFSGSAYSCSAQIARFDFYPEKSKIENEEYLNICPSVKQNNFVPAAAEFIDDSGDEKIYKKIVMTYTDYRKMGWSNYIPSFKFYVWNSDKINKIHEIRDTVLASFTKLVGVVEGVPPMVLNGNTLQDAHDNGFEDISEFSFSRKYEKDTEKNKGIKTKVSLNAEFYGISTGFSRALGKSTSSESSYAEYDETKLIAYQGQYLLTIVMQPKFTKKYFELQDYSGKAYDTISTIECTGAKFDAVPRDLSRSDPNLNDTSIATYMNRNIDFDAYDHIYQNAFQYVTGAKLNYQVLMDEVYSHTDTYSLTISPGKINDNDSLGFFRLAANTAFETTVEITTTTTFGKEVGLNLHFPGGDKEGDIMTYKGLFHWLKWTEGENNWWVFEGMEHDKPWCMTYEIFSVKNYKK